MTPQRLARQARRAIGSRAQITAENPQIVLCQGFARCWPSVGSARGILATVSRIISHLAIAAAALVAGGLGALAFSGDPERPGAAIATRTLPPPPEQVRTVVVTKTIHRVRHVRVHPRHPAVIAAPPAPAPPPAPVVVAPRPVAARAPAPAPSRVTTRTSGHAGTGGGEHEHEGGGDD